MNEPRIAHSLCEAGEYIYAFGGMNHRQKTLSSVERLRLHSGTSWELIGEMP